MSSRDHTHQLMKEIGPVMGLLEVTAFNDQTLWTLVLEDETVIFADFHEDQKRLTLSANVGTPLEAERDKIYAQLLQYNNQWQETDGVRMAVDNEDEIVQLFDLSVVDLELSKLHRVIDNFVSVLRGWRDIFSHTYADIPMPDSFLSSNVIKV